MDFGGDVNEHKSPESESFRVWARDFDEWPTSWMHSLEDLAYGRKLLSCFSDFLNALYSEGMTRKTFVQYRDNLWLLGGTIIGKASLDGYPENPLRILAESVADGGILPDHFDHMGKVELRAFEQMCRRFEKFLKESK